MNANAIITCPLFPEKNKSSKYVTYKDKSWLGKMIQKGDIKDSHKGQKKKNDSLFLLAIFFKSEASL